MSDIFDRAQELEEAQRQAAIDEARSHAPHGESEKFCTMPDCGEPIPEARRQAVPGCKLCVDCQERLERFPALKRYYG
jgi:phage/conjugal plasmid C-4 type zinc finger TraR family protein